MASITVVVAETKPTIDIPKSPCGDIDEARSGANTERGDSAPPTPRKLSPTMPKRVKEEEDDDPLTYLTQLFGFTTLDDSDDSGSEDDESAPPSPRPKGFDKYFFYTTYSGIHYYDCFRNVYRENGTLVHDGSFNFPLNDLFSPSFSIDGVPYCFDLEGLLSNDVHGTPYRVLTWQNEPDVFDLAGFVDSASSQADATVYQHNVNSASYYDGNPMMAPAAAANEYPGAPKTKSEIFSPNVDQNSLQQTLQGGRKLTWSPTSSVEKSPIVPSGSGSRASSADPPLFSESRSSTVIPAAAKWHYAVQQAKDDPEQKLFIESQPDVSESIPLVTKWKEDVVRANKEAAQARPSTKPLKEDRRRCHHCSKVFRRPSSLLDHLNVHSGDKPHVCPFPSCNTGFATKSNMKRHFLTHQVGLMEDYHPGVTRQPGAIRQPGGLKLKKAIRPPTAPYNSKAHHTLRFRVSAGQES